MDIDQRVLDIVETIEAQGYTVVIVGGYVRDTLLQRRSSDYDLATNAPLEKLTALFNITNEQKVAVLNEEIHTVSKVEYEGISVEITRFREETYDDNFKLQSIKFVDNFKQDILRRDFSINALAYNKDLIDECQGMDDLKNKVIRTIGDPELRFQEDPSRMIRALRFSADLGFKIDDRSKTAILKHRSLILHSNNINHDLKLLLSDQNFDHVYEEYEEVFSVLSNGKFKNIKLNQRSVLNDDRVLLAYLVFVLKLNYDNTLYKHLNFSLKDKKFILSIKPLIRELQLPLTQNDIVLLYLAYGQTTMLRVYDMMKELDHINELNLLNIKKVYIEGYLKIDQLEVTINDLNDSYTIKQKYRILKDIQKLIIRNQIQNDREELLNFIQSYY